MMEQYLVWFTEWSESADDGLLIKAYDAEDAANERVKKAYSDEPFDNGMTAMVRGPFGEITAWNITPEPSVYFYSRELTVQACDDCDFTTTDPDVTSCPDSQCGGSVG